MNLPMGSCIKELVLLLTLLTLVQHSMQGWDYRLNKCCPKGLQLGADLESCIALPGQSVSSTTFQLLLAPIDNASNAWVHPKLLPYNILVRYWESISKFKLDVTTIGIYRDVRVHDSLHHEFEGEINPLLVLRKRYCYDIIPSNETTYVLMETRALRRIFKCCSKGERLNMTSNECQQHQDLPFDPLKQEEVVGVPRGKDYNWLPKNLSEYVIKIKYSALQSEEDFNVHVLEDEEGFSWRILEPQEEDRETIIWFRGRNVTGVTDAFCFDETTDGGRVLFAALYDVYKCCGRDEQMNDANRFCAPTEKTDRRSAADAAHWLPTKALSNTRPRVRYDATFQMAAYATHAKAFITNESLWRMEKATNVSLPRLIVNFTQLSGNVQIFNTTRFCFDFLRESTKVAMMHIPDQEDYMRKCCFPGEIFSPRGVCEKHKGQDWTPRASKMNAFFKQSISQENIFYPLKYYCSWKFDILPRDSPRALRHYQGEHVYQQKRFKTEFCNEWQRKADGGVEEVVGSCETPEYSTIYEKVVPVAIASAVLFASAAGAACANGEMRRSGHGYSLACHALCLAAADVLQVADFYHFAQQFHVCFPYMYCTYFFMVAANWWLTVITFNIYNNFRQPLGAMAAAGATASGGASVWRRFGVLSAIAWSGSLVLTAIAVVLHRFRLSLRKSGFPPPSFLETRTCTFDLFDEFDEFYLIDKRKSGPVQVGSPQGSVFYYLVPMALLSGANLVAVILTARRVSHLRRGNSILKRAAAAASQNNDDDAAPTACLPPQHTQMVLLYTKLLLTSGILELSLEAVVWTFGRETKYTYLNWGKALLTKTSRPYLYASIFTIVDFARALLVFWMAVGRSQGAARAATWARGAWTWMKRRGRCFAARRGRRVGAGAQQPEEQAQAQNVVAMADLQAKDGKVD